MFKKKQITTLRIVHLNTNRGILYPAYDYVGNVDLGQDYGNPEAKLGMTMHF